MGLEDSYVTEDVTNELVFLLSSKKLEDMLLEDDCS